MNINLMFLYGGLAAVETNPRKRRTLPSKKMFHITSREANTGAFGRSPVGLPVPDNQKLRHSKEKIWNSGHRISANRELRGTDQGKVSEDMVLSSETLTFMNKLLSENLRLRQTLEELQLQFQPEELDWSQKEVKQSRFGRSYADACKHSTPEAKRREVSVQAKKEEFMQKIQLVEKPKVCWYYLNDKCHFGERCRNLHTRTSCKYFQENRCWFGKHCWYRHENVSANRSKANHWSMPVKADGSRKEQMKKSKSLPSQVIKESVSHADHEKNTEVKTVYIGENSVKNVTDANGEEIKDSGNEILISGLVKNASKRKRQRKRASQQREPEALKGIDIADEKDFGETNNLSQAQQGHLKNLHQKEKLCTESENEGSCPQANLTEEEYKDLMEICKTIGEKCKDSSASDRLSAISLEWKLYQEEKQTSSRQ